MAHGQAVMNCPHCSAQDIAMTVLAAFSPPGALPAQKKKRHAVGLAMCPRCGSPLAVRFYATTSRTDDSVGEAATKLATVATATPENMHLVLVFEPTPAREIAIPAHVSEPVARALRQAEENFLRGNSEEAAATMYRRAIDIAVKEVYPDAKGDLMPRILKLVSDGRLPRAMGDWAHQVRVVGNDGAHDLDGVTPMDVSAARGFADAFLRYLITLPKEVELRRAATAT